ncbi:MAG: ATP-binding protein, partial [Bacteroidota bacterium]
KSYKVEEALAFYFEALELQTKLQLKNAQASTLNFIGLEYLEQGQYQDAVSFFRKAYALQLQMEAPDELLITAYNLSTALTFVGKKDSVPKLLERCRLLAEKTGQQEIIGKVLLGQAQWYIDETAKHEKAKPLLEKATSILEEVNSAAQVELYHAKGTLHYKEQNWPEALSYFRRAIQKAEMFQDLEGKQYALGQISQTYRQLNNPAQALYYSDLYHEIRDSLVNENSRETINRLHIAYESEQKDRQNLALQRNVAQQNLALSEQRNQRNLVLGIGTLLLLLGGGLFWRYRVKQQARLLAEQRKLELERERQAQLAALDAMKSRFFANISHEFRTPLTLILGQNEALQQQLDDPAMDAKFDMVDRNGQRLLGLINQVLDLAKLEEGKLSLASKHIDLIPFLRNLFYSFESLADQNNIKLIYSGPEKSLVAGVDPEKLERILFNLLSNAFKFTPKNGQIELIIETDAEQMRIGVKDNGTGISADKLARIFDRFYQVGEKDTPGNPGTGIGLALARELTELHGGSLTAESEPNKGSIFWLSLPNTLLAEAPAIQGYAPHLEPATALDTAPSATHSAVMTPATGERILVVEDNPDVRAYLKDRLQQLGYQVALAEDGQIGLETALKQQPDLIISDVMMPRMDGLEFAQAIRSQAEISHIPLILLTARASEESKLSGLETGVDAYLTKPFNSRELQIRIRNLIQQRKQLRERFSTALQIRPEEVSVVPLDQQFLQKITDYIEAHMDDAQLGVEALSEVAGMSVTHLNRKLKALIDQSAGKLIRSMRMQRGAELLQKGAGNISEIAYDLGFQDPSHFTRSFKRHFGVSPTQWLGEQQK